MTIFYWKKGQLINMNILYNDLSGQWKEIEQSCVPKLTDFFNSGMYIGGEHVEKFEHDFSQYVGRKYTIGVSNGTDGLKLAIQALNLEGKTNVIMSANTYIANMISVDHQIHGEYEVTLLDHDDYFLLDLELVKDHLTKNRHLYDNVLIVAVHLYGQPINMKLLENIANQFNCRILEDASQSHGALYENEMVGSRSDICVYSLYPGKSLGAIGDAGVITTDDSSYAQKLYSLRNYGSSVKYHYDDIGWNNRLDPLQAIILSEKLNFLDTWNDKKIQVAKMYDDMLKGIVVTPKIANHVTKHVYHIYAVLCDHRDDLQRYLHDKKIPTVIHYPIPIHKTKPYLRSEDYHPNTESNAKKLLSLPIHPYLTPDEISFICESITKYYTS